MKPTEVDSMNRLRVQAENKAALLSPGAGSRVQW